MWLFHYVWKLIISISVCLFSVVVLSACQNPENVIPSNSETTTISSLTTEIQVDGAVGKLSGVLYRPELSSGDKTSLVILMHGFMSDKNDRIITTLASELQKKHIAFIRFDFNGHGDSEGDFQNMTVSSEIADARKIFDYARQLDFADDIILLGHSQGGVVASMLAGELGAENVASTILMAPAAVLKDNALDGIMFGVRFNPVDIPEYISLFNRRVGHEYLKEAQTLPIYETASQYTGPVCIIHGTSDEIVPYSYGVKYTDVFENAVLHLIENENHAFFKKLDEAKNIAIEFIEGVEYQ